MDIEVIDRIALVAVEGPQASDCDCDCDPDCCPDCSPDCC
jgi:hypothetical protein